MKRINITLFALMLLGILFSCTKASINYTQNGNWVSRATWPGVPMGFGVSFVANGDAYVGLGINPLTPNSRLVTFYKYTAGKIPGGPTGYDSAYGSWTSVANFIGSPRSNATAFTVQNIGYVGTGVSNDGFTPLADFFSYNPGTNTWSEIDSIHDAYGSYPRFDAASWSFDTVGYVLTGTDNNYFFSDVWKYSPQTGHWTRMSYLVGNPRSGATTWVYKNHGYIVGGYTPGSHWSQSNLCYDFWVYDPVQGENDTAKAWGRLRDIYNTSPQTYDDGYTNIIRKYGVGFVMLAGGGWSNSDDRAYITLGQNGTSISYTWEYDFAQDLWYEKTPYEGTARSGAVGFSLGNGTRGFVGTGLGTGNTSGFGDLEEFFPTQIYNQYD